MNVCRERRDPYNTANCCCMFRLVGKFVAPGLLAGWLVSGGWLPGIFPPARMKFISSFIFAKIFVLLPVFYLQFVGGFWCSFSVYVCVCPFKTFFQFMCPALSDAFFVDIGNLPCSNACSMLMLTPYFASTRRIRNTNKTRIKKNLDTTISP